MRRARRPLLALSLVAALLWSSMPASAARLSGSFYDDDTTIHESAIEAIAAVGVTRGCNPPDNDRFCPNSSVTRGQMAAFLRRAFSYADAAADHFVDDQGSPFEADINAIAEAGVTLGVNPPANDRYAPDRPVARDEMASFLARALGLGP